MPVPKRKHSKGRRDRRRSRDNVKLTTTVKCSHCGTVKVSHRTCPQCGDY